MTKTQGQSEHVPVFYNEVLEVFRAADHPVISAFDGTFGRGGHARAVLDLFPNAKMVAFDWDEQAIQFGQSSFASEISAGRLILERASYAKFAERRAAAGEKWPAKFNLMLLDLGVSSPQLDQADRGFSFYQDGPLDMRMDQRGEVTAADIINTWDEQDLARLFIEYGEVQRPFRVVRAIVNDRKARKPFETTRELASMIERVDGWHKKGSHPATRYFLALRMKVNEELKSIEDVIPDLIDGLAPGGVLAIITFHSLEDRVVKNLFKDQLHLGSLVNKKVIKPSDEEIARNPRSRSAKLRAFKKNAFEGAEK
jgi:16S rRNA (cytosine1402-N4)-methyltransferase